MKHEMRRGWINDFFVFYSLTPFLCFHKYLWQFVRIGRRPVKQCLAFVLLNKWTFLQMYSMIGIFCVCMHMCSPVLEGFLLWHRTMELVFILFLCIKQAEIKVSTWKTFLFCVVGDENSSFFNSGTSSKWKNE